jgi:hypothetical protein
MWWIMLNNIRIGALCVLIPAAFSLIMVTIIQRTKWFKSVIKLPFAEKFRDGITAELVVQFQVFSILCGGIGIGIFILGIKKIYDTVKNDMPSHMTDSWMAIYYFQENLGLSALVGFLMANFIYFYVSILAMGNEKYNYLLIGFYTLIFLGVGLLVTEPLPDELYDGIRQWGEGQSMTSS